MTKTTKSLFVTFEGGDGSGKTTLIKKVAARLTEQGFHIVKTREPGGSPLGELIRKWLLNRDLELSICPKAELLLFLASRAQHIEEVILPAMHEEKIILCDRFNDSTIAYQGVARGLGKSYVQSLCDLVCGPVTPQLTFFLDVDPEEGLKRSKRAVKENAASGEGDRMESEKLKFHQLVREGMIQLSKENPDRIHILDASQSIDAVFNKAWSILLGVLGK